MTLLLYLLVSLSGAAVLALEIVGTRVLGPFYGVSIYLWSALITVTLAALSLGYLLGGRWADRGPRLGALGVLLAGAGLWTLFVPLLEHPLLRATEGLGLRLAVLLTALILFAPPLTLLGMVSPYAIRLKARTLGEVGRTAGDLFAVSTVASVLAALATGFWLVPFLGVNRMLLAIGALLLAGAAVAVTGDRQARRRSSSVATTLLLLAAAGSIFLPWAGPPHGRGLVLAADSPYADIRVLDRDDGRYLLIDGGVHTILGFGSGESLHRYVPVMESCQLLFDEPGRMLLIGLGGGLVARDYHEKGWKVDAVEIDPLVRRVAREYFDLPRDGITVHLMDGRRFLATHDTRYDLILVDAFGSSSIPFHLVSREMFALLASHLNERGVMAMNVETRQWHDPLVAALAATMRTSFARVWALPTQEPPNTLGNVVMLASNRPGFAFPDESLPHPADHMIDLVDHWRTIQMNHGWDNRFEPEAARAVILSDDRNRVDLWSEEINRLARQDLLDYFGDDEPIW